ncbi:MAG TPA: HDOD domain-containing protein, partial [Casimicrobiaceae bacterium]
MNREEFRTLDVAGRLPTPNAVALKLLRLLKSDTVSAQEIARAIKCDPALAGRVIGAANSIATRGPRPVASALEALARVGTAATCRLALGFSVLSTNRSGPCSHFDYRQFWVRSLLMGITMQTLATRTRIVAPEESFTVGLLAEIGQLALATLFPDTYGTELAQVPASDRLGRIAVERAAFATDHVELGQLLLSAWGFPETLIEPVACYGRGGFDTLPPGSRRFLFAESLRLAELTARTAIEPAARDELMDEILETIETL